MTWTAGATNDGVVPTFAAPRRRAARRTAVAVGLAFMALLLVDCLNLSQSTNWTDLRQGPHMAAVHSVRAKAPSFAQHHDRARAATVPTPLVLVVGALAVFVARRPIERAGVRSRHGPPTRGPPTLRFT